MSANDDIKKGAKDIIIGYLKEKRKSGSSPVEERTIYADLKKEHELGTIEVMSGLMLLKQDIRNGGKDVEITKREGYTFYKYNGQLQ